MHAVLAAYPREWLLIFDNAPDATSVRHLLPPAGQGRVLITSQSRHWPAGQVVDVPVLDTQVAAGFLVNRTADPDEAASAELAGELGGLPLALEQAAAYITATGIGVAGYVALFRQRRAELLVRGEVPGHPATVAATLGLALSRLEDKSPAASGLLRLLAYLAPEPIPLGLLLADQEALAGKDNYVAAVLQPLLADPVAAAEAATALRRYSLVTPAGGGLVLVHRLVQAVTIGQMAADLAAGWQQAAATLIEAAIPEDTRFPATWPACTLLLPHAQAALAEESDGIARIALYLQTSHRPRRRLLLKSARQRMDVSAAYREVGSFRGLLQFAARHARQCAGSCGTRRLWCEATAGRADAADLNDGLTRLKMAAMRASRPNCSSPPRRDAGTPKSSSAPSSRPRCSSWPSNHEATEHDRPVRRTRHPARTASRPTPSLRPTSWPGPARRRHSG